MKKILLSLALVLLTAAAAAGATYAYFTSVKVLGDNYISSGNIDFSLNDGQMTMFPLGSASNLGPGDATDPIYLNITNTGSLNLAFFSYFNFTPVNSGGTGPTLADAIYIRDLTIDYLKSDNSSWKAPDVLITDGVGTTALGGHYQTLIGTLGHGLTLNDWNADNMQGAGDGIFSGALKRYNKYKITMRLGMLPSATAEELQGASMAISYTVRGTQLNSDAFANLHSSDNRIDVTRPALLDDMNSLIQLQN